MAFRQKVNRRNSSSNYNRRVNKTHKMNLAGPFRGGIRL